MSQPAHYIQLLNYGMRLLSIIQYSNQVLNFLHMGDATTLVVIFHQNGGIKGSECILYLLISHGSVPNTKRMVVVAPLKLGVQLMFQVIQFLSQLHILLLSQDILIFHVNVIVNNDVIEMSDVSLNLGSIKTKIIPDLLL